MQSEIIGVTLLAAVAACSVNFFSPNTALPPGQIAGVSAQRGGTPDSNSGAEKPASSRCVEGDCFDAQAEINGTAVPLRGRAVFRVLGRDLYTSALYVSPDAKTSKDVLADVPKRLVIHCRRDFIKDDILRIAEKSLKSNPTLDIERLQPRIHKLSEHMESAKRGDEYALTYLPGRGTQFEFNGRVRVVIPGADFARAFFGIWVSPYSVSQKLRLQLLASRR